MIPVFLFLVPIRIKIRKAINPSTAAVSVDPKRLLNIKFFLVRLEMIAV